MKQGIHPEEYRLVIFKDMSNGYSFLCNSCAPSKETEQWEDGNEYPLVKLDISSQSHPFFTGKMQFVDTAGRIDKFKNRYGKNLKKGAGAAQPKAEAAPAQEAAPEASAEEE